MGIAGESNCIYFLFTDHMLTRPRIYKPKYADDSTTNERPGRRAKQTTPEKKPRDKSRTRTIFGRKKSVSQRDKL